MEVYVERSSCQMGSEVDILIIFPWGEKTSMTIRLDLRTSNNEVEYDALLLGLRAAQKWG